MRASDGTLTKSFARQLIFKLIGETETQRSACVALDCLLEVLGNDIEPYIPSLMESLLSLLETAPLNLKGTVVGAIGSAAHASKAKFAPYFEPAMQRIIPFLSLTEEGDQLDLRGVAQDTVGTLAESVGKEMFRPYFEPLMSAAFAATTVPNAPQLKECSYIFFAVISRVYAEEFAVYLPTVMPILLAAIQQSEIDESTLALGECLLLASCWTFLTSFHRSCRGERRFRNRSRLRRRRRFRGH